jgi:broad specificity phosphatase PhoE
MKPILPEVFLVRHGETEWSVSGRHTGLTDLPLTPAGDLEATHLRNRLYSVQFAKVFTSPLQRARRTCELSGYGHVAQIDGDLVEWDYGDYEGKTRAQILSGRPGWVIFRDGCPSGELPNEVAIRADRAIARIRNQDGNVLLFSSGHFLRVFIARWLGFEPACARFFKLATAALSVLGYDHGNSDEPVVSSLNERVSV